MNRSSPDSIPWWRCVALGIAVLMFGVGLYLMSITMGLALAILPDWSASNTRLSAETAAAAMALPSAVGRPTLAVAIGAEKREIVKTTRLAAAQLESVQAHLRGLQNLPAEKQGSPITEQTVNAALWLRSHAGGRPALLILCSDAQDDKSKLPAMPKIASSLPLRAITVLIIGSKTNHPYVGELLRTLGARVQVVGGDPRHMNTAVAAAVSPPHRVPGVALASLGLLLAAILTFPTLATAITRFREARASIQTVDVDNSPDAGDGIQSTNEPTAAAQIPSSGPYRQRVNPLWAGLIHEGQPFGSYLEDGQEVILANTSTPDGDLRLVRLAASPTIKCFRLIRSGKEVLLLNESRDVVLLLGQAEPYTPRRLTSAQRCRIKQGDVVVTADRLRYAVRVAALSPADAASLQEPRQRSGSGSFSDMGGLQI